MTIKELVNESDIPGFISNSDLNKNICNRGKIRGRER